MNRKLVGAWALFDFANSVYPAVIQTAVFSLYYTSVVVGGEGGRDELWWSRAVSLSALIVAVTAPCWAPSPTGAARASGSCWRIRRSA